MTWLKTDPSNGMLLGPDGCHYETEQAAAWSALLEGCGCGNPVETYNFAREVLQSIERGERLTGVEALVTTYPEKAAELILNYLSERDVIDHGTSIGGSWLTDTGKVIIGLPEWEEPDE